MTGNNKVWRMPVACLASVAMLATVGVSAMTANAADADEVVLDANYGMLGTESVKTVTDADKDGWLDELYTENLPKRAEYTFTGWYESKSGGEAVDPTKAIADGTRLYAHWAANTSNSTVTFSIGSTVQEEQRHRGRRDDSHVRQARAGRHAGRLGRSRPLTIPATRSCSPVPGRPRTAPSLQSMR